MRNRIVEEPERPQQGASHGRVLSLGCPHARVARRRRPKPISVRPRPKESSGSRGAAVHRQPGPRHVRLPARRSALERIVARGFRRQHLDRGGRADPERRHQPVLQPAGGRRSGRRAGRLGRRLPRVQQGRNDRRGGQGPDGLRRRRRPASPTTPPRSRPPAGGRRRTADRRGGPSRGCRRPGPPRRPSTSGRETGRPTARPGGSTPSSASPIWGRRSAWAAR